MRHTHFVASLAAAALLTACGNEPVAEAPSDGAAPQDDPYAPNPQLVDLPAAIDLDPCGLMDAAALADLEIDTVAGVTRVAGIETIHNTGTKAPFRSCSWSSPTGVPTMGVRVYHAPDVEMPSSLATPVDVGDGGWLAEEGGRVRLFVKTGDRLVELSPQAPKYYGADDATYLSAIFEGVAARLDAPADALGADGPLPSGQSLCDSIETVPSATIFFSDVLALPYGQRIYDTSSPGGDRGEYEGCTWVDTGNNRYSVSARYLDEAAHKRAVQGRADRWKPLTIAERSAQMADGHFLIDLGDGRTLEVTGRGGQDGDVQQAAEAIVQAIS